VRVGQIIEGVPGFSRVADRALYWSMICRTAEERYKILAFWDRHGLAATQDAYDVSRRTLYVWRAKLARSGGNAAELAPRSTRPQRVRRRVWPTAVVSEIRRLRTQHGNLGKEKLHPLLQRFCTAHGWPCPAARTIGRLIADTRDKMRLVPARPSPRFGKAPVRPRRNRKPKGYRPETPGDCVAFDSIERRRDGVRRYLITCLDLASRFGFAVGVRHLSSLQARAALELCQLLLPVPMHRALSDNGYEFAKHFSSALHTQGLTHWHTYPRTPRMNAHCERFNRTVQEEFVDYREDLLFDDLTAFNDHLLNWVVWYNAERPHHSLGLRTPLAVLADHCGSECQMSWPNTTA